MSGSTGSYFPRWQWAALIGAPIALSLGYLYYRAASSGTTTTKQDKKKLESVEKSISIDKDDLPEAQQNEVTPLERAQKFKVEGNKLFHGGQYDKAIESYDRAIAECPDADKIDLATFYQNRAAAYEHLGKWKSVIADCTKAFELNQTYIKALQRRAKAFEKLEQYEESLEDITAVCILQRFSNSSSLVHADRVLRAVGQKNAKSLMENRGPISPSKHFVKNFFLSFVNDPIVNLSVSSENPSGFINAKDAFDRQDYDRIIPHCTEEIEAAEGSEYRNHALLLRGTFYVLSGQMKQAEADLEQIIAAEDVDKNLKVNALIKISSLYMQTQRQELCFANFEKAEQLDPKNADIFHHRGQVFTLTEQLDAALNDYSRAIELAPEQAITLVHKLYAEYRMAYVQNDMMKQNTLLQEFSKCIDRFPNCTECYSILAQILTEQGRNDQADEFFQKAIKMDPQNATLYVHRGLLKLQSAVDVEETMKLIYKAITVDDKCEFAYETLGTIEVQRGNLEKSIELFEKAIALAKTELELTHLCSLKDAAVAQMNVAKKFGIDIQKLAAMARSGSDA